MTGQDNQTFILAKRRRVGKGKKTVGVIDVTDKVDDVKRSFISFIVCTHIVLGSSRMQYHFSSLRFPAYYYFEFF